MADRLLPQSLERTLASLDRQASEFAARAGHLAVAAHDADRWGLCAEAEDAMDQGRRSRAKSVMFAALAAGVRVRLLGARS